MLIENYKIAEANNKVGAEHQRHFEFIAGSVQNVEAILEKLIDFQIAIPS